MSSETAFDLPETSCDSPTCPSDWSDVAMNMSMEHWGSDADTREEGVTERELQHSDTLSTINRT